MIRMSPLMPAHKLALYFLMLCPCGFCRLSGLWCQKPFLWTILLGLEHQAFPDLWIIFEFPLSLICWLPLSPLLTIGFNVDLLWLMVTLICCQLPGADRDLHCTSTFLNNVWLYQKLTEIGDVLGLPTDRFMFSCSQRHSSCPWVLVGWDRDTQR